VSAAVPAREAAVRRPRRGPYPPRKLARLVTVKDAYNPDNAFHLNQKFPPSRTPAPANTVSTDVRYTKKGLPHGDHQPG
jgi:hypothetical protein